LSIAQPFAALAQMSAPAPLPPAAQEALDKGIVAAKVPDYTLAIRYFEDARKLAPQALVIFLNLGIAESKLPGRELRAIAWFGAYLAASPDAPNATAVREQIAVLEVRNQSNVSRLIKSMQDAARHMRETVGGSENLPDIAKLWAEAGDIPVALKTADLVAEPDYRSSAQAAIAAVQARNGDSAGANQTFARARETASLIQSAGSKSYGQKTIAEAQIGAGDIAGAKLTLASALKTADLIEDAESKSNAQREIAVVQMKAGDAVGAQKTLTSAQRTADLIQGAYEKGWDKRIIAEAQIEAGDIAGAKTNLLSALKTVDLIKNDDKYAFLKRTAQLGIAEAQIKAGDIAAAQKTADIILDPENKSLAESSISRARARAANPELASSARQQPPDIQPPPYSSIEVSHWLALLDDANAADSCPLNTEPFLDLTGRLSALPPSDDPQSIFESLRKTGAIIVKAQNVIHQMLKQQAGQ
jgi:hypothetical protein